MASSTRHAFPSPTGTNVPDVPTDMTNLANAIDNQVPYVSNTAPTPLVNGLIWYNPTTGQTQITDGSTWYTLKNRASEARVTANTASTSGTTESATILQSPNVTGDGVSKCKITVSFTALIGTVANDIYIMRLRSSTAGAQIGGWNILSNLAGSGVNGGSFVVTDVPATGSLNYYVTLARIAGTGTGLISASSTTPFMILVEQYV